VLSTGLELARASAAAQVNYIRALARTDVRALALELVQWMTEVPDAVRDTAREIGFPVVIFRCEVSFAQLTRAAHERILRPHSGKDEPALDALVDALIETGRDRAFLDRHLGPVLQLPPRPRATLLATLEALLATQFNIAETARRLGVRRQSIYYRLDQLNGLLGPLNDAKRQPGFLIALALLEKPQQEP
jgi:DNA-binding PucR family transcriptional regulator